ncbi:MAG: peptidase T4, partial [Rhodospirillaceae bacterium]|nr:peptidase T4 [Rhodospirillaceae bacterium]
KVDAIVLSGGSAFGLDAAGGVMAYLRNINRGLPIGSVRVPIVPQAILFDLENHSAKSWQTRSPYWKLGFDAASSPSKTFSLGNVGAGMGANAGSIKGGLGSSSFFIKELGLTVGALVAVNSAGNVLYPKTRAFYAWDTELNNEFGGVHPPKDIDKEIVQLPRNTSLGQNTTLAVIGTDAKLTKAQARRLAIIAQDGLGRAIRPAHTPFDGDTVFTIATGRQNLENPIRDLSLLGGYASNSLSRAIARAVYEAQSINNMTAYSDLK